MFGYYLQLAIRNLRRNPGLTALMIGAVALGIAVCVMTLTMYRAMSGNPIWWKNDVLYAVEASHDYDPGPDLEKIRMPLVAVNSADDLVNPPELGILEREIKRVAKGRAVVIPLGEKTRGHGSHTIATLWKGELETLLKETEK